MAIQQTVEMNEFMTPELAAQQYIRELLLIARQLSAPHKQGIPPELQPAIELMGLHIALETISFALISAPQVASTQDLYRETIQAQGGINQGILALLDHHPEHEELLSKRLRAFRAQYHPSSRTR